MKKKWFISGSVILCFITLLYVLKQIPQAQITKPYHETLSSLDLQDSDNLMIVAHPDDETIWGGAQLLKENYFVVCLTNGDQKTRKREFEKVLRKSNSKGIILDYPDKVGKKRSSWGADKNHIKQDLSYIVNQKNWKKIVTHNPQGEYGHAHHKMTSQFVRTILKKQKMTNNLFYFGDYYKAKSIPKKVQKTALNKATLKTKQALFDEYKSQKKVGDKLKHMYPYENLIPYTK